MGVLLSRVSEQDKRRSEIEATTVQALSTIAATQERTANELGRFRDETGAKLNGIALELAQIKGKP